MSKTAVVSCSAVVCLCVWGTVAFLSAGFYGSLMSRTEAIVHVPRGLETVRVSGSYRLSVQELSWPRLLHFFDLTCVSVRLCVSEHQLHGFTCHVWEFHLSGAGRIVGILRPRLRKSAELTDISSAVGGNACVSWFYVDLKHTSSLYSSWFICQPQWRMKDLWKFNSLVLYLIPIICLSVKLYIYQDSPNTLEFVSLFCSFSQVCSWREGVCRGRGVSYGPVLAVSVSRRSIVLFQSRMCQAGLRELLHSWRRMLPRLYRYWTSSVQLELDLSHRSDSMCF